MSEDKIIVANRGMVRADFNFWVGRYLDKFYDNFENKKVVGNKCVKCGAIFVPPRKVCGECNLVIPLEENWVDLPETGTLMNFTATPYRINDRKSRKAKNWILGMVQIDGSNTSIIYKLLNMELEDVKIGIKVKIEWNETTKGDPSDIKGFNKV